MSTETENTSCNSLAEHCALNGMKRTSIFKAVGEAIASRLGHSRMDPKLQGILSETAQKHTEIMESNEESSIENPEVQEELSTHTNTETQESPQSVSVPVEETPTPVNDENFGKSAEKVA